MFGFFLLNEYILLVCLVFGVFVEWLFFFLILVGLVNEDKELGVFLWNECWDFKDCLLLVLEGVVGGVLFFCEM